MKALNDDEDIRMAISGYELRRRELEERITDLEKIIKSRKINKVFRILGARAGLDGHPPQPKPKAHVISPEGRKRIAEAQKKRWAKARKNEAQD